MLVSIFFSSAFVAFVFVQAWENMNRAERENEFRMERISRMQNYRTNLREFNEHTQKHFAKLEQSRNAREPDPVILPGTVPGLNPDMTAEQNRQILERLEHNSAVLKRMDTNTWAPRWPLIYSHPCTYLKFKLMKMIYWIVNERLNLELRTKAISILFREMLQTWKNIIAIIRFFLDKWDPPKFGFI